MDLEMDEQQFKYFGHVLSHFVMFSLFFVSDECAAPDKHSPADRRTP